MSQKNIGIIAGAVVAILIALFVVFRTIQGDTPPAAPKVAGTSMPATPPTTPSPPDPHTEIPANDLLDKPMTAPGANNTNPSTATDR